MPSVRGSMTSITLLPGSRTEARARLKLWPGNATVVWKPQRVARGGMMQNWTASPGL